MGKPEGYRAYQEYNVDRLEELLLGSSQVLTTTGPGRAGKSCIMRRMGRLLADKGVKKKISFLSILLTVATFASPANQLS